MPINNYSGAIYNAGELIPNYVTEIYTPHVWYDQSKRYKSYDNIFDKLMVSETLMLGDSESDMWDMEEILEEVLKYLNLHIIQDGYDYYIFDWETVKNDSQVIWVDIFTGATMTKTYSSVSLTTSNYASDDTQLTMADVYNQISVKDDVTEMDDVLFSPFDSKQLTDITYPQKYCTEYAAPGEGTTAFEAFYGMVRNGAVGEVNEWTTAYKKNWYLKLKKANEWKFLKNGQSVYDHLPVDGYGNYINQWQIPKYLFSTPLTAAILSFGEGDEFNKNNIQEHENISSYSDYLCINVGGNGVDEGSSTKYLENPSYSDSPGAKFPNDNQLRDAGMEIRYDYATDGNYSPASDNVHNYIVFSGKFRLTTPHECTGGNGTLDGQWIYDKQHGFYIWKLGSIEDYYNKVTDDANKANVGGNYIDWMVFKRKDNTMSMIDGWSSNVSTARNQNQYKCVTSPKNDSGAYYSVLFYDTEYPEADETENSGAHSDRALTNLIPPADRGIWSKRFRYSFDDHSFLESGGTDYDIIPCVDVLACQLQIGNMICREKPVTFYDEAGIRHANKEYEWVNINDLYASGDYTVNSDGSVTYDAYINLSMDIDNNQFVIGEEHDMWNNVRTSMGLQGKKGIAIPLPYEDSLSGKLKFSIIGPVNSVWNNGIRRHPTWFRHTTLTDNYVSILPHVGQIWIKDFKAELCSDRGKKVEYEDADIVYRSDEQKKFINKKDDIEFRFTTALTDTEAEQMKVNITNNRSDVTDDSGKAILSITDNHTLETDKPEKIYVDAYYREYCVPRTILTTTVNDVPKINPFNKFNISFMNKIYYMLGEEKNLKMNTTTIKLKER